MFRVIKESEYVDERQHCFLIQVCRGQTIKQAILNIQKKKNDIYIKCSFLQSMVIWLEFHFQFSEKLLRYYTARPMLWKTILTIWKNNLLVDIWLIEQCNNVIPLAGSRAQWVQQQFAPWLPHKLPHPAPNLPKTFAAVPKTHSGLLLPAASAAAQTLLHFC